MQNNFSSKGGGMSDPNNGISSARGYLELHARVVEKLPFLAIEHVSRELLRAYEEGRRIYLFGNGGSASLASHFACDLGKGAVVCGDQRKRFQAIALTDNLALLTAWANDSSYDNVFAEQLRNLVQPGDIAFAISGGGNSPNVLLALQVARELGALNIGLGGFQGGKMKALCDICLVVPSNNMQIIEDLHVSIAHTLFTIIRHRISSSVSGVTRVAGAGR
jgi:D-sedoheptulose 7-phosphate isomerase